MTDLTRRGFLGTATACGAFAVLGIDDVRAGTGPNFAGDLASSIPADFPSHPRDVVREVVGAAHVRFERLKELVTERPALAKVSYDWGFGDWESALGAASHMGRRDIAEFLMARGARATVFTFVMLGSVDAVKSIVESVPGIQRTPGPHGISMLQHARNALQRNEDKASQKVIDYLESLGDADPATTSLAITDEEKATFLGKYTFGDGPDENLSVILSRRGILSIQRGEQTLRMMHRVEPSTFAPSGSPSVRIRFEVVSGRATSLTVHDPMPIVKALFVKE